MMETYYEGDLKDLWDSDLEPSMQDGLDDEAEMQEWFSKETKSAVVLHDRLMTDAALGALPIKTEHSYSLNSDGDSAPSSPAGMHSRVDDMEDECYPAIPLQSAWNQRRDTSSPVRNSSPSPTPVLSVKKEPPSRPCSPARSPSPSSTSSESHSNDDTNLHSIDYVIDHTTGSIHLPQSSLRRGTQILLGSPALASLPKLSIKVEPNTSTFGLPPTPPSSLSSEDSEGALSPTRAAPSPPPSSRRATQSQLYSPQSSRQPIHTPLISSQPKGSTGTLILTEEEKRTLMAEGYPVPTRLPLTKSEEKSLKKIRRKIKNKISAQESRRKKKEYMDQLERKVEILLDENSDYRKKVEKLEQSNASLMSQLASLQATVTRMNRI